MCPKSCLRHTYTLKLFVFNLKVKSNWASCIFIRKIWHPCHGALGPQDQALGHSPVCHPLGSGRGGLMEEGTVLAQSLPTFGERDSWSLYELG